MFPKTDQKTFKNQKLLIDVGTFVWPLLNIYSEMSKNVGWWRLEHGKGTVHVLLYPWPISRRQNDPTESQYFKLFDNFRYQYNNWWNCILLIVQQIGMLSLVDSTTEHSEHEFIRAILTDILTTSTTASAKVQHNSWFESTGSTTASKKYENYPLSLQFCTYKRTSESNDVKRLIPFLRSA